MASFDLSNLGRKVGAFQQNIWRLVPEELFLPGLFLPAPKVIEVLSLPLDPQLLAECARSRQSIAVQIAPGMFLQRSVTLPKAAAQQAESAIALQMRQTLPAAGKGLLWRAIQVANNTQTSEFQVFILKQTQLDAVVEAFAKVGADVSSISLSGFKTAAFWSARSDSAKQRRFWLVGSFLLGILPALWTIFDLERQVSSLKETAVATEKRIIELQTKLIAARDEANKAESETATLESDITFFTSQTGRLQQLADLTQALPDEVWVSELTIMGNQLSMSGFTSGDVVEIVAALQELPWVDAVQLEGPVNLDSQSGQSRFQLGSRIKPNAVVQ